VTEVFCATSKRENLWLDTLDCSAERRNIRRARGLRVGSSAQATEPNAIVGAVHAKAMPVIL